MASSGDTSQVKFFNASGTSDGSYDVIAAVTNKRLRILSLTVSVVTTAGAVTLQSGSTTIGILNTALGVPFTVASPSGVCQTATSEKFAASNGAGVDSAVFGSYVEVEP